MTRQHQPNVTAHYRDTPPVAADPTRACRDSDPGIFFPPDGSGAGPAWDARAKAICAACPVWRPCLDWALRTGQEWGVWGGLNPQQRRNIRRRGAR
ncbi:WhiB family transcriptional regulator [Rhizomonospora bruguierae]|uniref:WhiB family transcriptional regulator n=1 Tax=Rhizomonospora bruguierae TaxID=1581705 RepID=UPI001BCB8DD4|nr:WhiB family transcriptional regulator [Micromonospora sp. NBRC 107566]